MKTFFLGLVLFTTLPAVADTLTCDTTFVQDGDEVSQKSGIAPIAFNFSITNPSITVNGKRETNVRYDVRKGEEVIVTDNNTVIFTYAKEGFPLPIVLRQDLTNLENVRFYMNCEVK